MLAKEKERADVLLVKQGIVASREKAKAEIMAGKVFANGQRIEKPGTELPIDTRLTIQGETLPYVSRGGLKLAKAVKVFALDFTGQVVADIGASTGGFTDCALQNGAARVYAIDVGYGQLDWKLRMDERVIVKERFNARYLTEDSLPEKVDWVVCDVAFISLTKIFPAMKKILKPGGQIVTLIKPQFEAGKQYVGKKGVVKDPKVHKLVLENVLSSSEKEGFTVKGLDFSPIKGPEGNIEYLAWLVNLPPATGVEAMDWRSLIDSTVERAQGETE